MSTNYCLVIASVDIKEKLIAKLQKEALVFDIVTSEDGDEIVQEENILLSYEGDSFPDLNKSFPNKVLTLYIDGGDACYQVNGNWALAVSYNAGISLHMGYSLLESDLDELQQDEDISAILDDIRDTGTLLSSESDDGIEQVSHEVIIESELDLMKVDRLSQLLKNLGLVLTEMGKEHFITWFEGAISHSSGELHESFLYPLAYADAFWEGSEGSHRLHITNSEIFLE